MRVVLDTVVFVRALLNPHNACGRILFTHFDRYQLVVSEPVLKEILEVLQRPELTRRFSRLASLNPQRVLEILASAAVVVIPTILAVSRDPSDDKFVATAHAAGAAYLVSADNDLVECENTRMLTCVEFVALLEAADANAE